MQLTWQLEAWTDYCAWLEIDRKVVAKINQLIADTMRHPTEVLGKPERLKHDLSGLWSRRINQGHRLVYAVEDERIVILQCKSHYGE